MANKKQFDLGGSLLDAAFEQEGVTPGHFADVFRSIYKQESSSGKNPKDSNQGAIGGAQILQGTFNDVADKGWNIRDPLQNLRAGIRYARQGYTASGGDVALTGAYYYGGPGGMARAKKGVASFDQKNPKAPSTLEYGQQIASRVGGSPALPTIAAAQPVAPVDSAAYVGSVFAGMGTPAVTVASKPAALIGDQRLLKPSTQAWANTEAGQEAAVQAQAPELAARANQKFWGLSGDTTVGAMYQKTMQSQFELVRSIQEPDLRKRDPLWMKEFHAAAGRRLAGFNDEEREPLRDAVSAEDWDNKVFRIKEDRYHARVISRESTGVQVGASVLAEVLNPVTWATGLGAYAAFAKAGIGTAAMVRAGRPAAAALSSAGENVVGNVAYTAVEQAILQEHKSVNDYALDAVAGLVPSVLTSPLAYRAGYHELLNRTLQENIAANVAVLNKARANVGADAPPDVLKAEIKRVEAQALTETKASLNAGPRESDRLNVPNLDEPTLTPEAKTERASAPTSTAALGNYGDSTTLTTRAAKIDETPEVLQQYGITRTNAEMKAAGPGTHVDPTLINEPLYRQLGETVETLRKQVIPDVSMHVTDGGTDLAKSGANGAHLGLAPNVSVVGFKPGMDVHVTAVHEVGHAVIAHRILRAQPEVIEGILEHINELRTAIYDVANPRKAALLRSPMTSIMARPGTVLNRAVTGEDIGKSLRQMWVEAFPDKGQGNKYADYAQAFDEVGAEQFVKFVEARALGKGPESFTVPQQVMMKITEMIKRFLDLFKAAREDGLLGADPRWEKFFLDILNNTDLPATGANAKKLASGLDSEKAYTPLPAKPSGVDLGPQPSRGNPADLEIAKKYGLDLMPQATPREKAEYALAVDLMKQSEAWDAANPTDPNRLRMLGNNQLFSTATPATVLASSESPLARMVAGTLLEQTTGATGRRHTAAIAADTYQRGYVGNAVVEYDHHYELWRKEVGGGVIEDNFKAENRRLFDRAVMSERESRLRGQVTNPNPLVKQAADVMDAAYERARVAQTTTKTVGWARLPDSGVGYTPHHLAAGTIRDMGTKELRVFAEVLTGQFRAIEGMDAPFATELARTYLDHARVRANGGHDIPANVHDPAAAEMVRGSLEARGLDKDSVAAAMARYSAGGPAHTKKRLHLDLNSKYPDGEGGEIQLLDLFETNQLGLLRNYARRVGGEVALAEHGVMGAQGLKSIRRALEFGAEGQRPRLAELEAFDQVAAELLGLPFGNQLGKWGDRVLTANATAKLGGMVYPQIAETINMVWSVGLGHTMSFVSSVPRLMGEVRTLAKGGKVDNGVLGSVEKFGGGGEFGLEGYKMITPYDNADSAFTTYNNSAVTWADRVIRSGAHVQKMLSMHRLTQAIQVRGVAEQIIHKAVRYIRDGIESQALRDMGFTDEVIAALKADIPNMVQYGDNGAIKVFDLTKATNVQAASEFAQAVHRGAGQIIQRTFIGETGKWAHDGYLRILTQFKNYPLVAMEKQWARNRENHGVAGAFGILLGSAAAVLPIYYARVAMNAALRPDKDEYLEKMLAPEAVARASLNYIGSAGMTGEFVDLLTGATGVGAQTGGRTGGNTSFIASAIPAAGFVDDIAKAAKEPIKALVDPDHEYDPMTLMKTLPFSRTPGFIPLINAMRDE